MRNDLDLEALQEAATSFQPGAADPMESMEQEYCICPKCKYKGLEDEFKEPKLEAPEE